MEIYEDNRKEPEEDLDLSEESYETAELTEDTESRNDGIREWRSRMRNKLHRRQKLLAVLLVPAILGLFAVVVFMVLLHKPGWHDSADGRYYLYEGNRVIGRFATEGNEYLFDGDGFLIEGPAELDGRIYYSTKDGITKGVVAIGGEEFWFDEVDGTLKRGFYEENGKLYYRNSHGFIEAGVRRLGDGVYCFAEDGEVLTGWVDCEEGRRYFSPKTLTMQTDISQIGTSEYYFDWNGYLQTGFVQTPGGLYYAPGEDGALVFGRVDVGGREYYFSEDGRRIDGVAEIDGAAWYLKDNVFCYGWIDDAEGNTFYSTEQGLLKGKQKLDGRQYCFEDDYCLARGWITREDGRYYFESDGAMVTGWQTIDGVEYCFADSGLMYVGEVKLGDTRYYFREDGAYLDGFIDSEVGRQYYVRGFLQTGITKIDGKYYYLSKDGVPTGGMQKVNGKLARYHDDGSAHAGWATIDGKKYYFGSDGVMLSGNVKIDGKYYYLLESGGFPSAGWYKSGSKYYVFSDGTIATGAAKVEGALYAFSDSGALITKEGLQRVGGKTRYVESSGKILTNTEKKIGSKTYTIDANGVATAKFDKITEDNLDEYLKNVIENEIKSTDIKALYNWVRKRCSYYSYYSSGSKGIKTLAVEAINKRCGACWHYAALMTEILKVAGYEARVIKGGGHSYSEHQWTIVKKDGQWYHIDAMRSNVFMVTTEQLKTFTFTYTSTKYGPYPGKSGYTADYYYGYSLP